MSIANKLENIYLGILRYAILIGATIALIAVIITGVMAINASMSPAPPAPTPTKLNDSSEQHINDFSVDQFRKAATPPPETQPQENQGQQPSSPKEDPFRKYVKDSAEKVNDIFAKYMKTVEGTDLNKEESLNFILSYPDTNGIEDHDIQKFYWETLLIVTDDLDKQIDAISKDASKKINMDDLLKWHLEKVNEVVDQVTNENAEKQRVYEEQLAEYGQKKATVSELWITAGGALGTFLAIIFTFLMVKIEINLRPLKNIAEAIQSR